MIVKEIIEILDKELTFAKQEDWDNSGLQIGNYDCNVSGIVIGLDLSENLVNMAIENNANLIITHHPFIFSTLKSINLSSFQGSLIEKIIKNNINVYSMHTSFDAAHKGITGELAKKLNISDYKILSESYLDQSNRIVGFGGIGKLTNSTTLSEYAKYVKEKLGCHMVKVYAKSLDIEIKKIAFCGGSGAEFISDAIRNKAQVYITGDIKYHDAQYAINNNLAIIDAGHFYTENIAMDLLLNVVSKYVSNSSAYYDNSVIEFYIY